MWLLVIGWHWASVTLELKQNVLAINLQRDSRATSRMSNLIERKTLTLSKFPQCNFLHQVYELIFAIIINYAFRKYRLQLWDNMFVHVCNNYSLIRLVQVTWSTDVLHC